MDRPPPLPTTEATGSPTTEATGSRERILEAAERLFARRGLAGVGMREIAQAAGLTPASLYNHFTGKDALYEAVLERGVRPLIELLGGLAAREPDLDASEAIVGPIMAHLARTPELPRLIQHEAVTGGERLARLAREWIRPLIDQGVAEMKREAGSPWDEAEYPLVISAWMHLVFGHFASAALLSEVFDEDLLAPEAIARQTRFFQKLARIMMQARSDPERS